jgi:hypothetical protein
MTRREFGADLPLAPKFIFKDPESVTIQFTIDGRLAPKFHLAQSFLRPGCVPLSAGYRYLQFAKVVYRYLHVPTLLSCSRHAMPKDLAAVVNNDECM